MKVALIAGIVLTMATAVVAQDATKPVEVYPAVTSAGGVLTLENPQDIESLAASDKGPEKVEIHPVKVEDGYVVVVSQPTYSDAEWSKVVKAIR